MKVYFIQNKEVQQDESYKIIEDFVKSKNFILNVTSGVSNIGEIKSYELLDIPEPS